MQCIMRDIGKWALHWNFSARWVPIDSCGWSKGFGLRCVRWNFNSAFKRPQRYRILRCLRKRWQEVCFRRSGQVRNHMDFKIGRHPQVLSQWCFAMFGLQSRLSSIGILCTQWFWPLVSGAKVCSEAKGSCKGKLLLMDQWRTVHCFGIGQWHSFNQKQIWRREIKDWTFR